MSVLSDDFMERVMKTEVKDRDAVPYRKFYGMEAVSAFERDEEPLNGGDTDE